MKLKVCEEEPSTLYCTLKLVRASPPVNDGAVQEIASWDFVRSATTSTNYVGVSGFVIIIAPLPGSDITEFP